MRRGSAVGREKGSEPLVLRVARGAPLCKGRPMSGDVVAGAPGKPGELGRHTPGRPVCPCNPVCSSREHSA